MKTHLSLILFVSWSLLLNLSACTHDKDKKTVEAAPEQEQTKEIALLESNSFRGYKTINEEISRRLFKDENFALSHYIEDTSDLGPFAAFVGTIKDLLGVQKGSGLHSGFQNGTPNSMNMTVWSMALSGLATDVKLICTTDAIGPYIASDDFIEAAKPVCQWPIHYSQRRRILEKFWKVTMQFDAPNEEFDAWFRFAGSPELRNISGEEALYNLTFAALYNPHFLIAK